MNIGEIDKNLKVETKLAEQGIVWHDVREQIFDIYGLCEPRDGKPFKRIPKEVADATNDIVALLYGHTSGGRVRFTTDSRYVALKCFTSSWRNPDSMYSDPKEAAKNKLGREIFNAPHGYLTASTGMDLYIDVEDIGSRYKGTFIPSFDLIDSYENIIYLPEGTKHITINMPLYNVVNDMYLGFAPGSSLDHGLKYKYDKPVVYYGNSITQGGCASRPGNNFTAIISRMLDCDFINLGFSDSGRGEKPMVDYIATLDMGALFMDYDHNAPNAEHLEKTHERMYLTVREKHPDIPIIMASMVNTNGRNTNTYNARRDVIYKTYKNALERGENVYFIDGQPAFGTDLRDACTVDGGHPNDFGFVRMAQYFAPVVRLALQSIKSAK